MISFVYSGGVINLLPHIIILNKREGISRLKFLTYTSAAFFGPPLFLFFYGLVKGAHNYKIHHVKITFKNLPEAFNGLKIVQVSDIHTGSYVDTDALSHAFDMAMELKPDIIFFTGDLVNDKVTETEGFLPVYQKLKAPMGVYSILGNHDYGDYSEWPSAEAKTENLEALKKVHEQAGWRLLMNEHVALKKTDNKLPCLVLKTGAATCTLKNTEGWIWPMPERKNMILKFCFLTTPLIGISR